MSRVFVAEETAFGRRVVVKLLSPGLGAGVDVDRFKREIQLAARLQHAHIVPLIAAGESEGLPWYTMPFVEGESLRGRIDRGSVGVSEATAILRDVAKALAYAHERGGVHRDIKPENVLISNATAVVTDFGIAKALSMSKTQAQGGTLTQVGTSLGTPAYMAPEQAVGDEIDHRADIYAWGVMAYELLTGKHPFASKSTSQQLIAAHISEAPASITGATIGRPLRELVIRCLAKDPAERPAAAAEILAILDLAAPFDTRTKTARGLAIILTSALLIGTALLGWRIWALGAKKAEARGPIMLAVLPFEHAGPAEHAPFVDGLTDAITAKLGALPSLAVIDRRSAAQYRGTTKPPKQIGSELGVQYLVEGVVRWAQGADGAWRAQVRPPLVDARAGTTKWTGEPGVITLDDPFTAQGSIATKVAEELRVALDPADRAGLTRRMTDNPEAFASYQRSRAIFDQSVGSNRNYDLRRAVVELEHAVAIDATFAHAWAALAGAYLQLAIDQPGDRAADAAMRSGFARATAHAPDVPELLMSIAYKKLFFDHDTAGVDAMVSRALASAPNDAPVLSYASAHLFFRQQLYDSAYVLARRAATLDPRSAQLLVGAAQIAMGVRKYAESRRYADALIALDSSAAQGWALRVEVAMVQGDTSGMQRELAKAEARLHQLSGRMRVMMVYGGDDLARRALALSAQEFGVATFADSITNYHAVRADAFTRLGDPVRARLEYQSIRRIVSGRPLSGYWEAPLLSHLALAQATLGQPDEARRTLARALAVARAASARPDLSDVLASDVISAVHAQLGEPDKAVAWLELAVANPGGQWTARGFSIRPKLFVLRGTPEFERFLRAHPD
jgi:TolB-like protein/tetratricopeptide (TPR) repeat protein